MIEARALDLEGGGFAGVMAVAEDQLQAFGTVADMELRACFERETFPFERLQHPHVREESAVVGQERLADVKARETLLFQDEDAFAGARQKGGAAAAARPAADHQRVVNRFRHASIKRQIGPANKREVLEPSRNQPHLCGESAGVAGSSLAQVRTKRGNRSNALLERIVAKPHARASNRAGAECD